MGKKEDLLAEARRLELIEEAKALEAQAAPPAEMSVGTKAAGSVRSALEGVTLGISEPVISGMMSGQMNLKHSAQEADSFTDFLSKAVDLDRLKKEYDADVARRRGFEAQNPKLAMYSEIAGAVAPALLTAGASTAPTLAARAVSAGDAAVNLVGQGAKQVVRALPGAEAALAAKGVGGSAARIAEAGASGAAQAVTQESVKRATQEATGFIQPEDELPSLGEVALTGGIMGGGMQAIPEAVMQGGRALKTVARVATGVRPETIDAYLANPDRIRNAKTIEEVKDEVDAAVQKLRDDVDDAKINKEQAKDILRQNENKLDDLIKENKNLLASQKADIRTKLREAKADFDIAFKEKMSDVKSARMPIQTDDVLDSVEKIKGQVTDLSQESYKILGEHKGTFKLGGVNRQISGLQNALKVNGQLLSEDSQAANAVLQSWKDKLKAVDAEAAKGLPAASVKRIIQELDSDIRTASDRLAGSFSDKTHNALMDIRRALDDKIKTQVAGYKEIMGEVSSMNQLRADLSKLFGKRESVVSKLSRIDNPNLEFERGKLLELGERTGKDFKTPLEEYMSTKAMGATPIAQEELRKSLPQRGPFVDALAQNARASRPEFGQTLLERARTASPEAAAVRGSQTALEAADQAYGAAKGQLQPFKRITPLTSESTIRTLMGDPNRKIELRRLMGQLGQVSDQDFVQLINDMRIRDQFEKGYQNGSANVNMWAAIFGATGALSGMDPTLGVGSAAAGATVGRFMDAHGPQITKRVLDGMIYMKGMPTVQKINSAFADLPPAVVDQLRTDLIRMVTISGSSGRINVPPQSRGEVISDIRTAPNLNSIEKAKAITDVNKTGDVAADVMKRLMIGDQKAPPEVERQPTPAVRPGPSVRDVSDFVKQKKVEAY